MTARLALCLVCVTSLPALCRAQVSGNSGYSPATARARAEQVERAKRTLPKDDQPPGPTSSFVEANVLMNIKADAYVAVFAVSQEAETPADCGRKMDATLKTFADELKAVGMAPTDVTVDYIAQHKVYGYQIQGDVAQEKLVGFQLKKNVLVRYKDPAKIDSLTQAAAKAQVYDLVKVDYVLTDQLKVRERLMEEAARVIKGKLARYEQLLGIKLVPPAQIYAERYAAHSPTQLYDAYQAFESEGVIPDRQRLSVRTARKERTFYFNGLDGDGFDVVINPVVTEPVVQTTLYLKLKYEVEQARAK